MMHLFFDHCCNVFTHIHMLKRCGFVLCLAKVLAFITILLHIMMKECAHIAECMSLPSCNLPAAISM